VNLGHSVQFPLLCLSLQFQVGIGFRPIQYWVIASQYSIVRASILPYYNLFLKGLPCGCWLPPANNVSSKGKTGLHSNTMRYDWEYVVCHIGEIGVLRVRFLLLSPLARDIRDPKCTANLYWVGVVIIEIRINLPPVLWWFRRRIQIERGGCQSACCAIAPSRCHFGQIFRH